VELDLDPISPDLAAMVEARARRWLDLELRGSLKLLPAKDLSNGFMAPLLQQAKGAPSHR
jgi:hypothetical protein